MAVSKQSWSVAETTLLLETLRELKLVERLDGRKARNAELYKQVSENLKEAGVDRTVEQIKNRWKSLKACYYKAKRESHSDSFQFFGLMDDLTGGRPLSSSSASGVDVGLEEDEEDCSHDDSSVADEESSTEDTDNSTQQIPTESEDSCPRMSRKRPRASSSAYAKALHAWATTQQSFLEKMQHSQNMWIAEQQERCLQSEERLLSRFIEESSRANERLIEQFFDGLKSIFPPTAPQATDSGFSCPPQHRQHHQPAYRGSTQFPLDDHNYQKN